jgi:two-component system, NtrC family, nitrogen regulation sensor histidine kinase NtrY
MTNVEDVATSALSETGRSSVLRFTGLLGPITVALALLSAGVTFVVLTGLTPIVLTDRVVWGVLLANAAMMLFLIVIIAREVWQIVHERRRGQAGAKLRVRIVGQFSVIAAAPAVLLAVFASITLDRGLDHWFSTRTYTIIANSLTVAEAYMREHVAMIRGDILAMANDIARAKPLFDQDRDRFRQFLNGQASIRGLPLALIIRSDLTVVERVDLQGGGEFIPPPMATLKQQSEAEPSIALLAEAKTVAAVTKLNGYDDSYLYVARPVDPRVVAQLQATQEGVAEYATLQAARLGVQVAFAMQFAVIALILLLSAVWIGINFANRLVAPIRRLIGAADQVSTGNLQVQVPIRQSEGELAQLGETFNNMTQELRTQRDDLIRAHDLIDSRRRVTEAVLAGASAGVIGIDAAACISFLNRSAEKLIARQQADALGRPLAEIVPELNSLLVEARSGGTHRLVQGQITMGRGGRERNLSIRVTTEQSADAQHGYVVTLDDITELVTAQRSSAWADVARRIAHEIKNPLTPIQLSAERLRRKYGAVITEDRAIFEQCTDTIVRQVEDIKRMVDEFSRFARMPKPVITSDDVADMVRKVVFLMRVGHPDIDIDVETTENPMPARFDRRLISQALTNIIKNATEAIATVPADDLGRGRIRVSVAREAGDIVIDVIDNGTGLPTENRSRLFEPYVTTREKGTGLGLAIVGRILEEHGGHLELNDPPEAAGGGRGAWARLRFTAEHVATVEEDVSASEQRIAAGDR